MRFSILAALCLSGSVFSAPTGTEKAADNYYEIVSRRVAQVGSTMQSLDSHLKSGAPFNFDRNRQQELQRNFFRRAIDLNDQVTVSMREGSAEMQNRIPHNWKMSLTESTGFIGVTLSMQSSLNSILNQWTSVKNAAAGIGASKTIAESLSVSQKTTSDFIGHIIEHQNALTSATGLDRSAKTVIENQLSRVVREYQTTSQPGGWA